MPTANMVTAGMYTNFIANRNFAFLIAPSVMGAVDGFVVEIVVSLGFGLLQKRRRVRLLRHNPDVLPWTSSDRDVIGLRMMDCLVERLESERNSSRLAVFAARGSMVQVKALSVSSF